MKIRSIVAATAVAGAVTFGAAGCDMGPACVSGHYDYIPEPIYNGKTTTITVMPVWECDVYASTTPGAK